MHVGTQQARAPVLETCRHCSPSPAQGTLQYPPQPLLSPHAFPAQLGAQPPVQTPAVQVALFAQYPWQRPPQPLSAPHAFPTQFGTHAGGH